MTNLTTYNRLSSAVPSVVPILGGHSLKAAYESPAGTASTARNFKIGDGVNLPNQLNENAERLDDAFRFGGYPVTTVVSGLTMTTDLTGNANGVVTIAAGKAVIDGLVELPLPTIVTINAGQNFIWLRQNGTPIAVLNALTFPTGGLPAVYLGMYDTATHDFDLSGVMVGRGGFALRRTNDANAPVDAPPATAFFLALTNSGLYTWDGISFKTFSNASAAYFFGNLPHTSTDPTTHDAWSVAGGVHLTPDDRTQIAGAIAAAAAAQTAAGDAESRATNAEAAAVDAANSAAHKIGDDDPRLDDARHPLAHAASHLQTGSDPVTLNPAQITSIDNYIYRRMKAILKDGLNTTVDHSDTAETLAVNSTGGGGGGAVFQITDSTGTYTITKLIATGFTGVFDGVDTYTLQAIGDATT